MTANQTFDMISTKGLHAKDVAFIKSLNASTSYISAIEYSSVMESGAICDCDDAFLCEHRLQYIVDYLKSRNL
jgi:hypothetical protein